MPKEREIAYEPHPVSPERKRELMSAGLKILDARLKPGGVAAQLPADGIGTDSGDQFSDDQLRAALEASTGKKPHHKLGREKLIEQFNALNAGRQEGPAADDQARTEIIADLAAMEVEFDPNDAIEDLAALRDVAREERSNSNG